MKPELVAAVVGLVVGWLAAPGINKTQGVRILDVVVLGPWLVLVSLADRPSQTQRTLLAFAGGATASYNLRNFIGNRNVQGTGTSPQSRS